MEDIKEIPTKPIPDGYYAIEWTLEGAILRDKINELIRYIQATNKNIEKTEQNHNNKEE